jgi:hypothetical protein
VRLLEFVLLAEHGAENGGDAFACWAAWLTTGWWILQAWLLLGIALVTVVSGLAHGH